MNKEEFTDLKDRGRGSWKKDSPPILRRPHSFDPSGTKELAKGTVSPVASSSLSADAKEWYPPNYNTTPSPQQHTHIVQNNVQSQHQINGVSLVPRFSVQDRLRINQSQEDFQNQSVYVNNVSEDAQLGAGNFQPSQNYNNMSIPQRFSVQNRLRTNQSQENYENNSQMNYIGRSEVDSHLKDSIHHLITVMCEVTFSPGSFDILCGPLVDSFASTLDDPHYTQPLVDAIVNQAISESNFRYNGARLCLMYDSVAAEGESVFRQCLFKRCATEEEKIVAGQENSENMRGFAMFFAELYTQLENPEGGRIQLLGERLCKILQHLLEKDDVDCIKSVCQILKLSGLALDADCPSAVDFLFIKLRRRADGGVGILNTSLLALIRNIINLRLGRWLTSVDPEAHKDIEIIPNGTSINTSGSHDSIYMPDGLALTDEESAFLQKHVEKSDDDDEGQDISDSDAWDTDMDAEMRAGFEEFLKMSNQIKR